MAVTKIWAIHDSVSRVVDYCTNPSKTKLSDLEQVLLYGHTLVYCHRRQRSAELVRMHFVYAQLLA